MSDPGIAVTLTDRVLLLDYVSAEDLHDLDTEALSWLSYRLLSRHSRIMKRHESAVWWRHQLREQRVTSEAVEESLSAVRRLPEQAKRDIKLAHRATQYRDLDRVARRLSIDDLDQVLGLSRELARTRRRRKVLKVVG